MRRLALLIAFAWSSAAQLAEAQSDLGLEGLLNVDVDPAGCIDEPALRSRLRHWLAPRSLIPAAGIRVVVSTDPVAFSLLRDGRVEAQRRFDVLPVQCRHRLDVIAVAIAVALEHLARKEPPAPEATSPSPLQTDETPQHPTPPAPAAEPERPTAAPATTSDEPPAAPVTEPAAADVSARPAAAADTRSDGGADAVTYTLLAHTSLLFEPLPATAGAFGVGLEVGIGALRFGLTGIASTETDTSLAGGRVMARLVGGRLLGCLAYPLVAADLHGEACLGAAGGAVFARGDEYPTQRSANMGFFAPLLRLALRYAAFGPLSFRIAIEGLLNAVQPELEVTGAGGATDRTALLGAALCFELLVELP